jgi:hypothetical protein
LSEGLTQAGYRVERVIPKFLPYTTKGNLPQANWLVALYLKVPVVWRILGKQFLLVATSPPLNPRGRL